MPRGHQTLVGSENLDVELERVAGRFCQRDVDANRAVVQRRKKPQGCHMVGGTALERDGLPDTAERAVPALLAEGNLGEGVVRISRKIVGWRGDMDRYGVATLVQPIADLELERQEATLVAADLAS